jgi:hypothetical protein
MVANWIYWWCVSGASKRIFATIKSTIHAVKFQIQYNYLHSNVIMCRINIHTGTCIFPYYWQDDVSSNQLKLKFMLFQPWNWYQENYTIKSTIDAVKFSNTTVQFSYLHSNIIMCIATLLTRWRKRQSSKISHDFQPWNWYHENYSIVQSQTRDIKQLH